MKVWQLQEAKAKLSQVAKDSISNGPQGISIHGNLELILISKKDYEKLTEKKKPRLGDFLKNSPLRGLDLDFSRSPDPISRDIDFNEE